VVHFFRHLLGIPVVSKEVLRACQQISVSTSG
jgi:hypothetical protein